MSSVAEVDSTLGRTLVGAVLQRDDCLAGTHLFVAELTLVLVRLFGPDGRLSILSGFSAKRLKADDYRVEVLPFPQVDGLEGFLWWYAELLGALEEGGDVLHALEGHLAGVDLLDRTGFDRVGEVTQQDAILEHFVEIVHLAGGVDGFAGDFLDPFQTFCGELFAVFGVDLSLGFSSESGFWSTVDRHDCCLSFAGVVVELNYVRFRLSCELWFCAEFSGLALL